MRCKFAFAPVLCLSATLAGMAAFAGCSRKGSTAEDNSARAVVKIQGDLYRAQNGDRFTIFLITPEGTILSDPINRSFAAWLKNELEESLYDEPVRYVVYTSHDWDRASGGKVFSDTAKFVAHDNMLQALALPNGNLPLPPEVRKMDANVNGRIERNEAQGVFQANFDLFDQNEDGALSGAEVTRGPLFDVYPPTLTYSDQYTITLGGKRVVLIHPGVARAADLTVLYFPAERVVFGADLLPVKRLPDDLQPNLGAWIDSLRKIEKLDFDIVVPARGMMGKKEDVTALRRYLEQLATGVADGIAQGKTLNELQASLTLDAYKQWEGYETNRPRHIAQVFATLAGSP